MTEHEHDTSFPPPADDGPSIPAPDVERPLPSPDESGFFGSETPGARQPAPQDPSDAESLEYAEGRPTPAPLEDAPSVPQSPGAEPGFRDPGQAAVDSFFGPARLDRPRRERPPLVPRWIWIASAATLALVLVVIGGAWLVSASESSISVPSLTGIDVGVANARLAEAGLTLAVSERQFSTKTAGSVLSQTPAPDTHLAKGGTVSVVISAGTEQFSLPDVVGDGVLLARGRLESKGLLVTTSAQPSQQPSDTVLASDPPPGESVHTGQEVTLTVAAQGPQTSILLPYDMKGITVVLDPAPVNDALNDVPLDISRRVRSLVEASNGTVRSTRALAETSTLDTYAARAQNAGAGPATVAIGLSAAPNGAAGLVVFAPSAVLPNATASAKLATHVDQDLRSEAGAVRSATSSTDTVLAAANAPWVRIQLGSLTQKSDQARFGDPNWEDTVARAIYRSIGALYAPK